MRRLVGIHDNREGLTIRQPLVGRIGTAVAGACIAPLMLAGLVAFSPALPDWAGDPIRVAAAVGCPVLAIRGFRMAVVVTSDLVSRRRLR